MTTHSDRATLRRTLGVLVDALADGGAPSDEEAAALLTRRLNARRSELTSQTMELVAGNIIAAGLVIGELIEKHSPEIGAGPYDRPPKWKNYEVGTDEVVVPANLTAVFDASTLLPVTVAIQIDASLSYPAGESELIILAGPGATDHVTRLVSDLRSMIDARNPLRGRALLAGVGAVGLVLSVIATPQTRRTDVIVPADVWAEIDLTVSSVTRRRDLLRAAGFSSSRGVLLAGAPGVGKTAITRAVAAELAGEFTIILADATAASSYLLQIYAHARVFGRVVIILDDVDLYVHRRGVGSDTGLAAFLSALDGVAQHDDVLTIATTNDPRALDGAATRSARFDSIITLDEPSPEAIAHMLRSALGRVPGADASTIDVALVASAFPAGSSGADVSEAVRRALLVAGAAITTATLLDVVGEGSHAPALPVGTYL
ncbi:ATP-binding protein [Gordonia sp. TBRC 11910]|uniref:ATP-binding protein n=1 Tax=Gordonia asplenii TaxID=2725283 RepID=A0A848L297_9ACTN|nr:ATP-binding protein [Gordonia asplenii]NMO04552.1 ATP-binding protein [Gordonia asplenii]